ncbi:hypothetical protein Kpol_1051p21 [Vanderwaltozyma polyspora DSM 70294]|uniref:Ethionine resistance-conferring protein 1 n=1 Tax=Vanderwaltozyma polyspora (strain ATCC 22028 / DSM 70294 / BCRC 21397 / CBS 2163 / NBRC 10782 / NRRL Y-8283 / UCD 57-17) TaxID=436907 RepID=A7TMY4_VANPO|nr:uncharacterized protein Kpol_1051p21 [Vanderwaltozyma polyspora DSM 70294]EDO16372.1 hypothetical protein Kpol_1051p21 [Vanderwaltozyma polyspora DSM 70294]
MSKEFTNTDVARTASFVYSTSVGKTGLFIPADYIPLNNGDDTLNERYEEENDSTQQNEPEDIFDAVNYPADTNFNDMISNIPESNEGQPLLSRNNDHAPQTIGSSSDTIEETKRRNRSSACISLIDQERDLLVDNKLIPSEAEHYPPGAASTYASIENEEREVANTWNLAIQSGKEISTSYKRELQTLANNATPLVFTFILQYSLSIASIFSVSHLGTRELGGVTLGSMTANITGFAAIQGLCTCLDTLCSQAYGAKNHHLVGILVQRCAIIAIFAFLPLMYIWWFWAESLLCLIIPEKELCILAAKYLKVASFGVPGFIMFECGKRFLQCQGIFHASTVVLFVCAPLNAVMNYVLVWSPTVGIGYLGAPVAVAINYWLMTLGLILYTLLTNHDINPMKCWSGLIKSDQIFKNWKHMFELALPGIIMVEAEFLGFEILTIFASHLGEEALGAQSIVSTIAALAYQMPFSISVSTSTRVANFIGASLYKACIITCRVSLLLSFACSSFNMLIIINFKTQIARAFSTEPEVVELVIATLPFLAFMELFDAFNASTAGCLRGQGRQKIGGYINLFAFYCIGIPLSYILAFHTSFGLSGLWIGITFALITMSILQGYYVFHVNWESLIQSAKLRNSEHVSNAL